MAPKKIPDFSSEDTEHEFWAEVDSTDYIDWDKGHAAKCPNLKPSTKTISIKLPESMIEALKFLANKKDISYQSLLEIYLSERLQDELKAIKKT